MKNHKIGFIGTGNIAYAIFSGNVRSGYIKPQDVTVYDTDRQKTTPFTDMGATLSNSISALVSECDYVFLTVKPQVYPVVLGEISALSTKACFVDVAAGISISYVKEMLGYDAPVVRVMPNTPLMCSAGSTALVHTAPVSDEQFSFVKGFFDSCGVTAVVDEEYIDLITAISGSAPAYVMRFAQNFISYAVKRGLKEEDAKLLVLQVFSGSAKMCCESDASISELISRVTSPGGTTQAGLSSLDNDSFDKVIENCLNATVNRAKELSK